MPPQIGTSFCIPPETQPKPLHEFYNRPVAPVLFFESFFGHYRTEEVYRSSYTRLGEGQVSWQLYRIWYEAERVHESLGYQTPQQRLAAVPRT